MTAKEINFEKRYAKNWTTEFRRSVHQSVGGICIHCKREKSAEIHHSHYKDRRGAIAGREKPGVDLFPLCQKCHGKAHSSANWIKDKADPVLGNRNTDQFLNQLEDDWGVALKGAKVGGKAKSSKRLFPGWIRFLIVMGCGWLVAQVLGWLGAIVGIVLGFIVVGVS
jgi:hypothetical protein